MELDQNQLAQIEQSVSLEQLEVARMLGQAQFAEFVEKLTTVGRIKIWAHLKESKKYKGLPVFDINGNCRHVGTWEEFCLSQGKSRSTVDEEIQNLNTFGEDFLETSQRMSLGYRDLRKLRKLDTADREIIINGESVKTEDRESLIDLIEEMSAKHSKDKEALTKKVSDLNSDVEAKEQIIKSKDEKLNQMDTELTKLKSPAQIKKRAESEPQLIAKKALEDMHATSMTMLNATTRFVNDANSILELVSENMLFNVQEQITQNLVSIFQQIAQTAADLNIQIDFEDMVTPSWTLSEEEKQQPSELEA